ncbi:MAG: YkgJ family cysteine cluster protein [Deltaproteobacteria bacterium]|nr:YkgJ family cysteine cluster protein [Deltaproteobacteria bacterium]
MSQPGPSDSVFQPLENNNFSFACHPEVTCFNECCARLTLVLTPYDILRLKNRLGISSKEFLDEYTETEVEEKRRFPTVRLKMSGKEGRPCPFVSPNGCTIYKDRPGACRIYPMGRGSASGGREIFFMVKEDHCQGFDEDRQWTREEWMSDQGLTVYNRYNDLWMEIITSRASLGPAEQAMKKVQMFFMASYNLDRFREFVNKSGFLARFDIDADLAAAIPESDEALLELGIKWLKFSLFGEKTLAVRS